VIIALLFFELITGLHSLPLALPAHRRAAGLENGV
jgi:hypothetical protein